MHFTSMASIGLMVLAVILYFTAMFVHSYYLLLKKGFTNHGAALFVMFFFLLSIILPAFPGIFQLNGLHGTNYLIYLSVIMVFVPAMPFIYAKYILKAPKRKFGQRNFKNLWQALMLLSGLVAFPSMILFLILLPYYWFNSTFSIAYDKSRGFLHLFTTLSPAFYLFAKYETLFQKKSIESIIEQDPRSPALFIRSFTMDVDPFFWGNIHKNTNHVSPDLAIFKDQNQSGNLTFQQFFSKAVEDELGPLIGLGDPSRYLPLEGLTSSYYEDGNWQLRFHDWAQKAVCFLSIPGETEGLNYELNYIFNYKRIDRFFIFTPPKSRRVPRISKWLMAVEATNWGKYAAQLNKIGYSVQSMEPPPGSVIGFDKSGNQKLLLTQAKYPIHYIEAVKKELNL